MEAKHLKGALLLALASVLLIGFIPHVLSQPPAPTLVSPENNENINDNTPFMDWDPATGADNYDLQIDNDSDYSSPEDDVTDILTDNYQVTTELAEGLYYWHVRGENAGGLGPWSDNWVFRIDVTAPSAPSLTSPDNGENLNDNTPTLDWSAVPDNSLPVLYYAAVSDNSAFPYENRNSGWRTGDQWNVSPSLPDGVWYWRVRARDNAGNVGDNSVTRSFRVDTLAPPVAGVEISISPSSRDGAPSATLNFTVTIKNTGNVSDTYTLENADNEDWTLSLSQDSVGPLDPDESDDVTLQVTIPDDAENCTRDNIIVTATSQENAEVENSASCIAHAVVGITLGVEVTISPSSKDGAPGENLNYTVKVKNTGNVADTYDLEKDDNENWTLSLASSIGPINPGASVNKTLQVTIPENAENCTRDNIIVTATSQTDNTVSAENSCIAHAVSTVRGVQVTIYPSENEGVPCENVTFLVTVKNIGNVSDNFDLTVGENLNWGPELDDNLLEVPAAGNRKTTLTVHIPGNTPACTRDKITVTATSVSDNTISDDGSCIAHAKAKPSPIGWSVIPAIAGAIAGVGFAFYMWTQPPVPARWPMIAGMAGATALIGVTAIKWSLVAGIIGIIVIIIVVFAFYMMKH